MSWEVRTMKSKKSCFSGALLRRNLSRFWAVWALAAAVMSLYFFATAGRMGFSGQSSESFRFPFPGLSHRDWSAWEYEPIINPIPPFLFGMLAAVCVFRYLHQARSAYMLHAFPLTRGTLFRTSLLSGFLLGYAPIFCATGVYTLALSLRSSSALFPPLLRGCLAALLQFIFFYGLAVLCMQLSGRTVTSVLLYGLLNVLFALLAALVGGIFKPMLRGVVAFSDALDRISFLSPVVKLFLLNRQQATLYYPLALCAVGFCLLALSWLLYRRRRLECCGETVAYRFLRPIYAVLITIAGIALFGGIGELFFTNSNAKTLATAVLLLCLGGAAVGFLGGMMLLDRTMHIFRRRTWLILAALVIALACGMTAAEACCRRVTYFLPVSAEALSYVEIAPIDRARTNCVSGKDAPQAFKLTRAEDIDEVLSLHGRILNVLDKTLTDDIFYGDCGISITYHEKNGKVVRHEYGFFSLQDSELAPLAEDLNTLLNRTDLALDFYQGLHLERAESVTAERYDSQNRVCALIHGTYTEYIEPETLTLNASQQQRLLELLNEDIAQGRQKAFTGLTVGGSSPTQLHFVIDERTVSISLSSSGKAAAYCEKLFSETK